MVEFYEAEVYGEEFIGEGENGVRYGYGEV